MMGSGLATTVMVIVMVAMMVAMMGGAVWGLRRRFSRRHRPHSGT